MRIRTITCHHVYNTGASLQAYALCAWLRSQGHDAKIIDYRPSYLRVHYKLLGVNNPKYNRPVLRECYQLAKLPGRILKRYGTRKRRFDRFTSKYLPLTEESYFSEAELRKSPPAADVYLAGSDQIWNTLFSNGKDPAFYLQFAPKNAIRASYAASFATDSVQPELQPQISEWLHSLDAVSVRESSGLTILQSLGITDGVTVVDPVFLLSQNEWTALCAAEKYQEPYLLVYDFDRSDVIRACAERLAAEKHLRIYTVQKLSYGDRNFSKIGPIEFVDLIRQAQYILSNSFHATAFSLIFHKEFLSFNRKAAINSRMRDLLEDLGLPDRMIAGTMPSEEPKPIDYATVQPILENKIRKSREFLDNVIRKGTENQ